MKLEPLKYYNEHERDDEKINSFLDDSVLIFKSFRSEFDEYLFPKSKKNLIKNLLKTLLVHIKTIRLRLNEFFRLEYLRITRYDGLDKNTTKFYEHLQNHGLIGSELNLKLSFTQDARDELIFVDRVLQNSSSHYEDIFYPNRDKSEKNTRRRNLKLLDLENSLKVEKQQRGINWFKVSISILKSIFGFFGMGKAIDELFDLLNSIFGDIPLKHKES